MGKTEDTSLESLMAQLTGDEKLLLNFIERCLEVDPTQRITPEEAMRH